jgi:hypothetical protein
MVATPAAGHRGGTAGPPKAEGGRSLFPAETCQPGRQCGDVLDGGHSRCRLRSGNERNLVRVAVRGPAGTALRSVGDGRSRGVSWDRGQPDGGSGSPMSMEGGRDHVSLRREIVRPLGRGRARIGAVVCGQRRQVLPPSRLAHQPRKRRPDNSRSAYLERDSPSTTSGGASAPAALHAAAPLIEADAVWSTR